MKLPEVAFVRAMAGRAASSGLLGSYASRYEQCRLDGDFAGYLYGSIFLAFAAFATILTAGGAGLSIGRGPAGAPPSVEAAGLIAFGLIMATLVLYFRLYAISSLRDYRRALIDASLVHVVGLMLAMAGYDVPLKRTLKNLSNLGGVYGEDIALEASYALSLVEEDGMDVISAIRKAQSTSPSEGWQDLLIGIAAVHNSGGSLREYLQGRYASLVDRKAIDMRRYNEKVQGASSIYLSVIGIAAIFVAIINLVFNMAGMIAGDALVWIDALVVVPAGSFVVMKALRVAYPEAIP